MDISVVINAHKEGVILTSTLRSVLLAAEIARADGHGVEIVVVLDSCDELTRQCAEVFVDASVRIIEVQLRDLGLARNAGVASSRGQFIAFVDGDDIWSPYWLSRVAKCADGNSDIWHPQYSVYFESGEHIFEHVDMDDNDFDVTFLMTENYWTSAIFCEVDILRSIPYEACLRGDGLGYEDWNFNCRSIQSGYKHKVAKGTVHYIRRRVNSMSREMSARSAICIPHTLFRGWKAETA